MVLALDGTTLGRCPIDSIAVPPGAHVLRGWPVEGRKFSSGSLTRSVSVRPGLETTIDLSDLRWVRVETEPFGAFVTREGVPLGETPLTVSVSPGDALLIVEKEGYRVIPVSTESLLSGPSTRSLKLEPAEGKEALAATVAFEPGGRERLSPSTVLLGMAVIGSATAAVVFNKEADDVFSEYGTTGNLEEMDELFRKAQRLDSWAVASWVVSEVTLGILLYHLLRDRQPELASEQTGGRHGK